MFNLSTVIVWSNSYSWSSNIQLKSMKSTTYLKPTKYTSSVHSLQTKSLLMIFALTCRSWKKIENSFLTIYLTGNTNVTRSRNLNFRNHERAEALKKAVSLFKNKKKDKRKKMRLRNKGFS